MKQQEFVVDLVKAAFLVLTIKVMASTSMLMPWNSLVDNLCIIFAVGVMLVKLLRHTFALRKLVSLAGIALLVLYTCVSLGQYDLLVSLVAICLLIDEDIDEYIAMLLKTQAILIVAHVVLAVLLVLIGKGDDFWSMTGNRLRFKGGFVHANVLAIYVSSCMLMFAWKHFTNITTNKWAWMAFIMVLTYVITRSRTGLLLHIIVLLLLYAAQREHTILVRLINPILALSFPILSVFIYWAQGQYLNSSRVALLLDELLTGRVKYAAYAFTRSGTTWLPRYLDYAAEGIINWTENWNLTTFTFDNLFSFMFVQMGMIWIPVCTMIMAVVCRKSEFKVKVFLLLWIFYAMVEVHGLNCFKFFPLLLLSTLLSKKEPTDESIANA